MIFRSLQQPFILRFVVMRIFVMRTFGPSIFPHSLALGKHPGRSGRQYRASTQTPHPLIQTTQTDVPRPVTSTDVAQDPQHEWDVAVSMSKAVAYQAARQGCIV